MEGALAERDARPLATKPQRVSTGGEGHEAIQLPPLSSPKRGPPQKTDRAPLEATTDCDMRTSGGGYRRPVTPEGGYRLRLTPECLAFNDSHRPIIHRLQHCPLENQRGFWHVGRRHRWGTSVSAGFSAEPPPGPHPNAAFNGARRRGSRKAAVPARDDRPVKDEQIQRSRPPER